MAFISKKAQNIGFLTFLKSIFLKNPSNKRDISNKKPAKANPFLVDTKKRAKIDRLLNDLAQRDAMLNAGKMQFLNFFDVKSYMGTKWKYVEPIIIGITLDVISKYTDEGDISFRYSEDEFIIIFAKASPQESQLKCQLITAEIQRLLFEETEKNEKFKDIKIDASHIGIKAKKLAKTGDPIKTLEKNFQENAKKFIDENFTKHSVAAPEKPDIKAKRKQASLSDDDFVNNLHYKYIPVEAEQNKFRSSFAIVIDDCPTPYYKFGDPLTDYTYILMSLSKSRASLCDLALLDKASRDLIDYPETSLFASVRYNTLVDNNSFQQYFQKLQKITPENKKRLHICVYKIPQEIPLTALQRSTMLIRDNCKTLFAIVPHFKKNNYAKLLNSGFKGICLAMLAKDSIPDSFDKHIQKFLSETKIYNFKTLALIGERDDNIITRDTLTGFQYIGGSVIERPLNKLDEKVEA